MARVAYDVVPVGIDIDVWERAVGALQVSPQQKLAMYGRLLHFPYAEIARVRKQNERTIKEQFAGVVRKHGDPRLWILEQMCPRGAVPCDRLMQKYPFDAHVHLTGLDRAARELGLSPQQRCVSIARALYYTHDDASELLGVHVRTVHGHWNAAKKKSRCDGPTLLRSLIVKAYSTSR